MGIRNHTNQREYEMNETLYGWTLKQWANATAILNRQPSTLKEACELLRDWKTSNQSDPSDQQIIETIGGDKRKFDYETAVQLFELRDKALVKRRL